MRRIDDARLPRFADERVDSVRVALLRHLVRTQVLARTVRRLDRHQGRGTLIVPRPRERGQTPGTLVRSDQPIFQPSFAADNFVTPSFAGSAKIISTAFFPIIGAFFTVSFSTGLGIVL
jgi:hypothetical protein